MRRVLVLIFLVTVIQAVSLGSVVADEFTLQTKTGIVTKVDESASQIVVMVARELTFNVTEFTKIVQNAEAKKLTDIEVNGKPFLMVSSNAKSLHRAQEIYDAAKDVGAKATIISVDVGKHDFPTSAYPAVREWLRKSDRLVRQDR